MENQTSKNNMVVGHNLLLDVLWNLSRIWKIKQVKIILYIMS